MPILTDILYMIQKYNEPYQLICVKTWFKVQKFVFNQRNLTNGQQHCCPKHLNVNPTSKYSMINQASKAPIDGGYIQFVPTPTNASIIVVSV